jgi:hypothetical protein
LKMGTVCPDHPSPHQPTGYPGTPAHHCGREKLDDGEG